MCGGTRSRLIARTETKGLSPRVRGNPLPAHRQNGDQGSIPACAGEPIRRLPSLQHETVYPRVCGGTATSAGRRPYSPGLSPRVRGNPTRLHPLRNICGSIPACAGEPRRWTVGQGMMWVYPRVCGGTLFGSLYALSLPGLSPRVRGNRDYSFSCHRPRWSIPACAGEPKPWGPRTEQSRVYPRVCGGTSRPASVSGPAEGLSPRVRGNLSTEMSRSPSERSIPACAGEPNSLCAKGNAFQVYPRVCGGTH